MASAIELYLIRHGIAEERGPEWPDDAKRPLTRKGELRMREEASGLAALGVTLDLVLTSPLMRARQTAEIVARGLPGKPRVEVIDSLSPASAYSAFVKDLAAHAGPSRVGCVGHEPDLGQLAARLIGAARAVELKKGAICRIDLDGLPPPGPGVLRWLATPRMLRSAPRG